MTPRPQAALGAALRKVHPEAPVDEDYKLRCLTPRQLAEKWGVTENALAKMRLDGAGPPFVKLGSRVRYNVAALQGWLSQRTYAHTTAGSDER